ncbi:MAG TPA: site-2 protease family protein [Candidatus Nanoarchaeia archaeon]|nr:site-2 protease family protein [Candidatus Nanoarchaeia archaeon]
MLFTLSISVFLYTRKHNLKREGLLYLYRTRLGLKFIEWTTKKYNSLLKKMQYPILASGYLLMFFGIWMILKLTYYYITSPYIAKALKVPIIMPLIPYLPEIFKIDFLPPFYFTYWIIIIAIIAVPHEFAHGIIARLNKIKILSTGFGFLGPFLAAFVEQDDKQMQKATKFSQLSVLAAGTFANVLMTIFFGLILLLFFTTTFVPAGLNFNMYSISAINTSSISKISTNYLDDGTLVQITSGNQSYFADVNLLNATNTEEDVPIIVFDDSPALRAHLSGAITEIGGKEIRSYQGLKDALESFKPGDNLIIKTIGKKNNIEEFNITLADKNGRAFLGIGLIPQIRSGAFGYIFNLISKIKDPFIYYQSQLGDFGIFIYDLLWWIVLISLSVALMNMLPLGIFDGGRFFYLTIWSLTGSEKTGKFAYKISTWFFLAVISLMLVKWLWVFLI